MASISGHISDMSANNTIHASGTNACHKNQANFFSGDPLWRQHSSLAKAQSQPISEATWEKWKPSIEFLYTRPEHSLNDVMRIMAQTHHFHATQSMYKKKIRRWGLEKNMKAEVKDDLAKLAIMLTEKNLPLPLCFNDGQPVDWERVKRREKASGISHSWQPPSMPKPHQTEAKRSRKRAHDLINDASAITVKSDAYRDLRPKMYHSAILSIYVPELPHEQRNAEAIFSSIGTFFARQESFSRPTNVIRLHTLLLKWIIARNMLYGGITELNRGSISLAREKFYSAGRNLVALLSFQDESIISIMYAIDIMTMQQWQSWPDYGEALRKLLCKIVEQLYQEKHPLAVLVRGVEQLSMQADWIANIWSCIKSHLQCSRITSKSDSAGQLPGPKRYDQSRCSDVRSMATRKHAEIPMQAHSSIPYSYEYSWEYMGLCLFLCEQLMKSFG